ncbi:TetR/AcrR family transcriptional regulator [Corallococcus sp. 4LFB]|uniref:TetR/AcrR family transcriptional regulator n=1 Tax=Corallococcus sp. 4LFB TaxID=3383249 RepID=UPI0039754582
MSGAASGTTRQEQERSRVTRQKLMTAAIEVLVEKGWAGATMGAIAERAGVSRGACQHHFPTRAALVAAAVEHVFHQQVEELVRRAKGLPESRRRVEPS